MKTELKEMFYKGHNKLFGRGFDWTNKDDRHINIIIQLSLGRNNVEKIEYIKAKARSLYVIILDGNYQGYNGFTPITLLAQWHEFYPDVKNLDNIKYKKWYNYKGELA